MPKLFSSYPFAYRTILLCLLGLVCLLGLPSPMVFAQAAPTPAPPATIDPAAAPATGEPPATTETPAADPAATGSSAAASVASSSVAPPEKPIYESTSERDNALLAKAQPDETLWLETPNEKIIARFKTAETRKTKGALLILHAPEVPQLWPAPLEHLRRNLPIYGWETMAVPLPQKYPSKAPERELMSSSAASSSTVSTASGASAASAADAVQESSAAASSAESASSMPSSATALVQSSFASSEPLKPQLPREQLIAERVDAAIKELNKVGEYNVVVLVDNSSAFDGLAGLQRQVNLATSNKDMIDGPLQALILVNLQTHEPLSKEQLASIFSVEFIPVMDVFFAPDDQRQKELRRLHHAEAMRKNVRIYQQVILPPENLITVDDRQGFWLEKVRGFMETKANGKELKQQAKPQQ